MKSNPRNNLIYGKHRCGKVRNARGIISAGHRGGGHKCLYRKIDSCLLKSRGDVNFELSWMLEVVTPALVSTTSVYFDMSKMLES